MKTLTKYRILFLLASMFSGFMVLNAQDAYKLNFMENIESPAQEWTQSELEVKAAVERILAAAGNYDAHAIKELTSEKTNMGILRIKDGKWNAETILVSEYLDGFKNQEPYFEPVSNYTILMSDGHLAIVKADAILYRFGVPMSYELDNFTLYKTEQGWKFVNISFTTSAFPENKRKFDIKAFAEGYNQAWCSQKPKFVAQFFAENGSLMVNNGEPAVGRKAIAEVVSSFMTAFPDMVLTCDAVNETAKGIEFHWTFTGTNKAPGGTGKKVKFSGMELWQLTKDGRIKTSDGHFDADEYQNQIEHGIED